LRTRAYCATHEGSHEKKLLHCLLPLINKPVKGEQVSILPTIHPYVGITRIRLEGIISAHTRGHPLIIGCKGSANRTKKQNLFRFSEAKPTFNEVKGTIKMRKKQKENLLFLSLSIENREVYI
jgi:hypothetical protein